MNKKLMYGLVMMSILILNGCVGPVGVSNGTEVINETENNAININYIVEWVSPNGTKYGIYADEHGDGVCGIIPN